MNKQIENLIRKSFAKDVEIKMLDRECDGIIISREEVLEILKELTDVEDETVYNEDGEEVEEIKLSECVEHDETENLREMNVAGVDFKDSLDLLDSLTIIR